MESEPINLLKANNLAYVVGLPNGSARSILDMHTLYDEL